MIEKVAKTEVPRRILGFHLLELSMHRVMRKKHLRREQLGQICLRQGLRPSPV
jgi:hypothetical protein